MNHSIGETIYWVESSTNFSKKVPCPMCFGKLFVTIILGDESQTKIECGFCQRGMGRPDGFATSWEPNAVVKGGVITGISQRDGLRYEVGSRMVYSYETYPNQETAEIVKNEKYKEEVKRSEEWFLESFITCKKKQIWSAGYHKEQIKYHERQIDWHNLRLGLIKEKAK